MAAPAPLTLEFLTALFPEFADETPARIAALNTVADMLVSDGVFGQQFLIAKAYMVGHMIAIGRQRGKGMVTSQRIGDISKSYAGPGSITSGLYLTTYGMQYVTLARLKRSGPFMVPQVPPIVPDTTGIPQ